jgi:3-hydroxyisobutyrate dehydrogenase-like beta-hydroxyacid dehydrogenase
MTTTPRIGFVGIGLMGLPMARRLLAAGYALGVCNRSRANVEALVREGAWAADTVAELAGWCEVVLAALPTPQAVREVFLGERGLVAASAPGTLLIDCSTVGPELSRAIHAAALARGLDFLDAPVSGGTEGAEAGTLTIMVGGDAHAFARGRPVLERLGSVVRHVGPSGAGSVMKLINQLLVGIQTAAAAEAAVFARQAGADLDVVLELVGASYGDSRMFRRALPRIIAGDYAPGGTINTILKDLTVIADVAEATGAPLALGAAAQALYAASSASGDGSLDMTGVTQLLERRAAHAQGAV